ncbi:major facilitator superfamily transporter [Fusarium heterosporum]|uniref:Major facilitator superfamily transporter n=1 Tax=Fusarium heterosporum TaxID=42747 RepID=A0A8H5WGT5_FUSHE|nr:major facilitator superfamily transporter [Fusarium heterosporum]
MATSVSPVQAQADFEKQIESNNHIINDLPENEKAHDSDDGSEIKQDGVKRVEAITKIWSPGMMWAVFIFLYLVNFVNTLLQAVHASLVPYVTSSFSQHGLLAITSVFGSIIAGASKLAIAKIIDIRGLCQNVETYAAGHTFYWVGHVGLSYILNVVLSDMTSLRNRMIMFGLYMSPRLASTFGGPKIAELFQEHSTYRWAFGSFCIILVLFAIPVSAIFMSQEIKAKKLGYLPEKSQRSVWGSTKFYFVEFDVVGMFLTIAGFSLILTPLNIATRAPNGWRTGYIIAMIVVGVVCLGGFAAWEKWYAKVPYVPFNFLEDRTILGACLLSAFLNMSIFAWDTYYNSYLQVVHGLDIATAGYTLNAFSVTSTILAPFIGLFLRWYGQYYWPAVFHGVCGGIWAMTGPLAIMAQVTHQEIAVVLALYSMFGSIGQAIGFGISGALWTNDLPWEMHSALPQDAKNQTAALYGDIKLQMADPIGTPVRDAVVYAYGVVQREMVIAGCAFLPLICICVLVWRNKPIDRQQTKGNVF